MASTQLQPLDQAGKRLARSLTALLRHGKPKTLSFRPDAFVSLDEVRTVRGFDGLTLDIARSIVHEDNKMRFSLIEESGVWYIRANQGHTIRCIDENSLLDRVNDPLEIPIAVHGTYFKAWPLIKQTGLSKMDRNHIHFAKGLPSDSGVISGMRKSAELLVYVDVEKAMQSGAVFFMSANGVILTSGVGDTGKIPADCFKQVVNNTNGVVIYGENADEAAEHSLCEYIANQPEEPVFNERGKGGGKGKGKGGKGGRNNRHLGPPRIGGGGGGGDGGGGGEGEAQQFKWPEYVGMSGETAAQGLRERFPQLKVQVLKVGCPVTMDHNLKRVRVFVDDRQCVVKPPKLG